MNIQDLINAKNAKLEEAKKLVADGKLDEAKKLTDEAQELQNQIDALKAIDALGEQGQFANAVAPVQVLAAGEGEIKDDAVHEFADAARHGFRNMSEGTPAEGGYTVPEDIQTQINKLKEDEFDLSAFVDTENVSTNTGRRTYQTRAQVTGFKEVGEGAKIGKADEPNFSVVEYKIKKYAGFLPVTNELLADSDANITATISEWLARQDVATRNAKILAVIDALDKTELSDVDGIKKAVNVTLGAKFAGSVAIYTNDDGLNYLDTLKDAQKRYLLTPDAQNPMQMVLAVGAHKVPVVVIPNSIMPSDTTTTEGKTIIPFKIGDLFEAVKLFDRQQLTIGVSSEAAVTGFNAFEQDMTLFRGIVRLDVEAKDKAAVVNGTITV